MPITTRDMSAAHEAHIAKMMGGEVTRGSGCTFKDQLDVRQRASERSVVFRCDGKSTFGKSLTIALTTWRKVVEQGGGLRPMMALRWYRKPTLVPELDLGVVLLADLSELAEHSRCNDQARALLKLVRDGAVQYPDRYGDHGTDLLALDLLDLLDGRSATRGDGLPEGGFPELAA